MLGENDVQTLSCKNKDGGMKALLLGQFGVSENLPSIPDLSPKSSLAVGGRQQWFYTHLGLDAVVGKGLGQGCLLSDKGTPTLC